MIARIGLLVLLIALCACADKPSQSTANNLAKPAPYDQTELDAIVTQTMVAYDLPALGVLIQRGDEEPVVAFAGVRKLGSEQLVTETDRWFIGSTAKPMTASLLATYVQEGRITFQTTLVEVFPEYKEMFTDETRNITVAQLLTHTAGLKPNPVDGPDEFREILGGVSDVAEQRRRIVQKSISEPLLHTPGTETAYSNTGYVLAGAVIEKIGGENYESLLRERVLRPLGITTVGFGQPAQFVAGERVDQPWGHRPSFFKLKPVAPDDSRHVNPPLFNPAGNLYISLNDWANFAADALRGRHGEGAILEQSLYEQLQMPPTGATGYSMGWGVLVEEGAPIMLTHNGSDGNWFADIRLYPKTDLILLTVTNDGREDGEAKSAAADIRKDFARRYSPY